MRSVRATSWKIVPDRSAHLLAHCRRDPSGLERVTASIVGSRSRAKDVDPAGRVWTVGVRLRPGALAPLAGIRASELTDRSVSFGAVWGGWGDECSRIVGSCSDPASAVRVLLETVEGAGSGRRRGWVARGLEEAIRSRPRAAVGEVAGLLGIAPRTLRRRCRETTGLTPKAHLRIARVHASIERARRAPDRTWGVIAAESGYADQAHLVRDFRSLIGEPPQAFRARGLRADSYKARCD